MKYTRPPVVETVLSVQFKPLANFGSGQLGAYWHELGPDWPYVNDVPAIDPIFERFETKNIWSSPSLGFKLSQKIDLRLQIRNKKKDRMIQVQNGRFLYNWLGEPDSEYPSYDFVRPEFDEHWNLFREFFTYQSDQYVIQPNQWEVVYVNHLPRGEVWNDLTDLSEALTFLKQPELENLKITQEHISGQWRFEISSQKGRLYLTLNMKVNDKGVPCVVMTFTARGPIVEKGMTLDDGLRIGHTTITSAFDRFTSEKAKQCWGVQYATE